MPFVVFLLRINERAMDTLIVFASGATYGFTSVLVGQPLDTVKTRMQAGTGSQAQSGMFKIGTDLLKREGVFGLYRGGLPLFVGGTLFRVSSLV